MACRELKWDLKEKIVYNVDTGMKEKLQFLSMNYINNYNNSMGDVDVAYQLSNNYIFYH